MNTIYRRLTFADREEISRGIWAYEKFAAIALRIDRPTSTVSREVWANTKYSWCYRAEKADQKSQERRRQSGRKKKMETKLSIPKIWIWEIGLCRVSVPLGVCPFGSDIMKKSSAVTKEDWLKHRKSESWRTWAEQNHPEWL